MTRTQIGKLEVETVTESWSCPSLGSRNNLSESAHVLSQVKSPLYKQRESRYCGLTRPSDLTVQKTAHALTLLQSVGCYGGIVRYHQSAALNVNLVTGQARPVGMLGRAATEAMTGNVQGRQPDHGKVECTLSLQFWQGSTADLGPVTEWPQSEWETLAEPQTAGAAYCDTAQDPIGGRRQEYFLSLAIDDSRDAR
ncbi:hypothetical protein E4U25_006529 [Claviceps purpurea]|nr:hypothetical protein E4U25_006529 [Claviceps purpurea]